MTASTSKINIVIPMAGLGSRFADAGYKDPKPFIDVNGVPMIHAVLRNLSVPEANYILIARKEHMADYQGVISNLKEEFTNVQVVEIDRVTEGTACTVLFAYETINTDTPLLIANSDQIVDFNVLKFVESSMQKNADGSILCFVDEERNPKWSFAKVDDNGFVTEVKEKVPISNLATVGIYYFQKGADFCKAAINMLISNDRVNGEFYTCPTYNYLIAKGAKIVTSVVPIEAMHGIGTPEDLDKFLKLG